MDVGAYAKSFRYSCRIPFLFWLYVSISKTCMHVLFQGNCISVTFIPRCMVFVQGNVLMECSENVRFFRIVFAYCEKLTKSVS